MYKRTWCGIVRMCRVRTRKISVHLRASSFSRSTNSTFHGAAPAFSRATAAGSSNRRGPAQLIERRALLNSLVAVRSEEHTSELQSPYDLVCRLLLEKKKGGFRQAAATHIAND